MQTEIKRHIVSAIITFLSAFFVVLGIQLQGDMVTTQSISYGLIISLMMTAGRAGVKAVVESIK